MLFNCWVDFICSLLPSLLFSCLVRSGIDLEEKLEPFTNKPCHIRKVGARLRIACLRNIAEIRDRELFSHKRDYHTGLTNFAVTFWNPRLFKINNLHDEFDSISLPSFSYFATCFKVALALYFCQLNFRFRPFGGWEWRLRLAPIQWIMAMMISWE